MMIHYHNDESSISSPEIPESTQIDAEFDVQALPLQGVILSCVQLEVRRKKFQKKFPATIKFKLQL